MTTSLSSSQTLWNVIGGASFSRTISRQKVSGLDRVQYVLNRVNRLAHIGDLPQVYDPLSYGLALALQTGRLGRLPTLYLSQMTARQVVNLLVKFDSLSLTAGQIPSWLNTLDLEEVNGTVQFVSR